MDVVVPDAETAEVLLAQAMAAGASGAEEREETGDTGRLLILYAETDRAQAVRAALVPFASARVRVGVATQVAPVDWSEEWRRGLRACEISPRLRVRPSFVDAEPKPGQFDLVIDPGQAFGTGTHPSTFLALELLDRVTRSRAPASLLDVGTGTGVLALAGLVFGIECAVGVDIDPLAVQISRENAALNGLDANLLVLTGGPDATDEGFDLVVANLLRSEVEPLLADIVLRMKPGGSAIFSGLLASEFSRMESLLALTGLRITDEARASDDSDCAWVALLTTR